MCAKSQNIEEKEFVGTHFLRENVYYIEPQDSSPFWLDSELSPYMEAYDVVLIEDDLVINESGSSIPLEIVQGILVEKLQL